MEWTASKWEVGGGCTGGSEERDQFLRQARWRGSPRGPTELVEDGPGHDGAQAKGMLQPTRWTLT